MAQFVPCFAEIGAYFWRLIEGGEEGHGAHFVGTARFCERGFEEGGVQGGSVVAGLVRFEIFNKTLLPSSSLLTHHKRTKLISILTHPTLLRQNIPHLISHLCELRMHQNRLLLLVRPSADSQFLFDEVGVHF